MPNTQHLPTTLSNDLVYARANISQSEEVFAVAIPLRFNIWQAIHCLWGEYSQRKG